MLNSKNQHKIITSKNTTYRNPLNFIFYVPLTRYNNSALLSTHRRDKLRGTRRFFQMLQIVIVIIKEDSILPLLFPPLLLMALGIVKRNIFSYLAHLQLITKNKSNLSIENEFLRPWSPLSTHYPKHSQLECCNHLVQCGVAV